MLSLITEDGVGVKTSDTSWKSEEEDTSQEAAQRNRFKTSLAWLKDHYRDKIKS